VIYLGCDGCAQAMTDQQEKEQTERLRRSADGGFSFFSGSLSFPLVRGGVRPSISEI